MFASFVRTSSRLAGAVDAALALVSEAAILFYQKALSWMFSGSCRFMPSCSAYALEAVRRHGALRGGKLTVLRLLRCHPFHPGGFDPVK